MESKNMYYENDDDIHCTVKTGNGIIVKYDYDKIVEKVYEIALEIQQIKVEKLLNYELFD